MYDYLPDQARIDIKAEMVCDEEFALAGDMRAEGWLLWLCQGRCGREDQPEATWEARLALPGSLVSLL